jgi:putative PIN family toxin of toxin-antitoxin system
VRAVIDTNVLVSGLLWHGAPHALLEKARADELLLVSSPNLLAELEIVITRPKFSAILVRASKSHEQLLAEVRQLAEVLIAPPLAVPVCRDPDDDEVLALAVAAQADFIVSGDDDLLSLQHYQNIPILTPATALQIARA